MLRLAIVATLAAQAVNAQFKFNPGTYNPSELYNFISANYPTMEVAWQKYLDDAKASFTGAYPVLTSIFATTAIPTTFDSAFASHLADELYKLGTTTVVDPLVNSATLRFTGTMTATSGTQPTTAATATATSRASTQAPTSSTSIAASSSDTNVFTLAPSTTTAASTTVQTTKSTAATSKNAAVPGASPGTRVGLAAAAAALGGMYCLF
ncbi:hypothetical protein GQ54DRAFT_336279 [Martensiomyces pterosporus]|nr:hypothetical protein GQ54DRAFT_336279 [Martensiomyces pterosporus]